MPLARSSSWLTLIVTCNAGRLFAMMHEDRTNRRGAWQLALVACVVPSLVLLGLGGWGRPLRWTVRVDRLGVPRICGLPLINPSLRRILFRGMGFLRLDVVVVEGDETDQKSRATFKTLCELRDSKVRRTILMSERPPNDAR
jgi:hypothetical protein